MLGAWKIQVPHTKRLGRGADEVRGDGRTQKDQQGSQQSQHENRVLLRQEDPCAFEP
jgi:hypothetical protein